VSPDLFSINQVAAFIGCTATTIRRREDNESFPRSTRGASNKRLYSIDDICNLYKLYNGKLCSGYRVSSFLYDSGMHDPEAIRVTLLKLYSNDRIDSWK
jgi:hypothetical protein